MKSVLAREVIVEPVGNIVDSYDSHIQYRKREYPLNPKA